MNVFREVKAKWMRYAPSTWWGDSIDVRFYLIKELRKLKGKTVLDIGSNIGLMLSEVSDTNKKCGLDISKDFIRKAKIVDERAFFVVGSMYELPFADDSFDVVVLAGVVEVPPTVELKHKLIAEALRVLKSKGSLLLTTPNREHWAYYGDTRKLSYEELGSLLEPYFEYEIYGWNPFPPFLFFLSPSAFARVLYVRKSRKFFFIPSPILAKIPSMEMFLEICMRSEWLRARSKFFFVFGRKK